MRVNIWRAAAELTWDFYSFFFSLSLERSKFPAVTELPSPAALIKTAAEPKAVARTSAHAQHKWHGRREEGAATAFSVSKIRKKGQ